MASAFWIVSSGYLSLVGPPSLDVSIFSRSEYNLFVVVKAKRPNNLLAMSPWKADARVFVKGPAIFLAPAGKVNELEVLTAVDHVSHLTRILKVKSDVGNDHCKGNARLTPETRRPR